MPSTTSRKRQSRLDFTPLPSSSPAAKDYHQQIRDRAAAVVISPSPNKRRRRDLSHVEQVSVNDAMPTPAATAHGEESGSGTDDELGQVQRRRTSRRKQQQLDFSNTRDRASFDPPVTLPSIRPRSSKVGVFSSSAQAKMVELSSSDSESDVVPRSSRKSQAKRVTRSSQRPVVLDSDDDEAGITFAQPQPTHKDSDEEEEEEEDMPTTMGKQPRKRSQTLVSSFINDSPALLHDVGSDSDVVEVSRPKKRRRRESDEEVPPVTPGKSSKRSKKLSKRDKQELAEDLDFLGPSSEAESDGRPPRSTQSAEKNARQRALDRLKAKRGKPMSQVAEEEEPDNEESANEEEVVDLISDGESDTITAPPMSSRQMFAADENDEDFLVEEEEESTLGVPEGIPLAFTRYASMKPKELFRYAVDWMVQKKINPGFNMNDEIYDLTFKKLDDEVRGLAGSKFESSAWTPEFTIALKARPEIAYHKLDRVGEHWGRDKCDACNRSGHPATYEVQFHGKPYYRETLEDVENGNEDSDSDSDDDDESDPDATVYDAQSREVLPETTTFYLGKFCMSNAITAHDLNHWRYHLAEVVEEWLKKSGYFRPDKVVERSNLSTRKLRKKANKIVTKMEEEGEVRALWKAFREKIDSARDSKQGRYRFGMDSP